MKNRNAVILAALALLILCALGLSFVFPKSAPDIQKSSDELELEFIPSSRTPACRHERGLFALPAAHAEEPSPQPSDTPAPTLAPDEVRAFLLVSVGGVTYSPIPLTQTGDFVIRQRDTDRVNVVHVTPDSVQMASSTCENQLCVEEGIVTLENKGTRILGGYIICLPNEVTLELYGREELEALLNGAP